MDEVGRIWCWVYDVEVRMGDDIGFDGCCIVLIVPTELKDTDADDSACANDEDCACCGIMFPVTDC